MCCGRLVWGFHLELKSHFWYLWCGRVFCYYQLFCVHWLFVVGMDRYETWQSLGSPNHSKLSRLWCSLPQRQLRWFSELIKSSPVPHEGEKIECEVLGIIYCHACQGFLVFIVIGMCWYDDLVDKQLCNWVMKPFSCNSRTYALLFRFCFKWDCCKGLILFIHGRIWFWVFIGTNENPRYGDC